MRRLAAPLVNGALLAISILTVLPLVWMLSVSLMSPGEASTFPPPLWPSRATLANYRELFAQAGLGRYLFNSVVLTAGVTLSSLLFNVAAGYAFAKLRFAGRDRIFKLLLGALVIPSQVAMVPLFLLLRNLGLVNTYGGIIVPALASIFGIFVVRQYALTIPDDMLEAARIDGASEFRIFRSIVIPVLRPIVITLAVFTSLAAWNDFMWPLDRAERHGSVHVAGRAGQPVARARAGQRADDGGRGPDDLPGVARVPGAAAVLHPRAHAR